MSGLLKASFQKKKTLALVIGLGLILSLVPLQFAEAGAPWWSWIVPPVGAIWTTVDFFSGIDDVIVNALLVVIFAFPSFIIGIGVVVAGFLSGIVTTIVVWMMEIFLTVPITHAPIVEQVGWPFARDLVNMLFILILVFIGLATILKIRDYEAKKTLPLLILVALLINFSLVIVGFVVDMGNILTNYFLQASRETGGIANLGGGVKLASDYFKEVIDAILHTFQNLTDGFSAAGIAGMFIYGIILIIYYIFSALILGIVGLLFYFRIIILWILAILAPFAFACYILPATRKWWGEWWKQLIQWSIIGIPIGFFLYLSSYLLIEAPFAIEAERFMFEGIERDTIEKMAQLLSSLLVPVTALIMLLFGVILSLQMAPSSASGIISFGGKKGKAVGKWAGKASLGVARGVPQVTRAEEKARKWLETKPVVGRAIGGPGAYERERIKKMTELARPYEGLPPKEIEKVLKTRPITYEDRLKQVGVYKHLIEQGKLSDEMGEHIPMTKRIGLNMDKILERRPDWASAIKRGVTVEEAKRIVPQAKITKETGEAMDKIEPEDFKKLVQPEALRNRDVVYHFMQDEMKFREMEEKGKAEKKRAIKDVFLTDPTLTRSYFPAAQQPFVKTRAKRMVSHPRWQV